MSIVIPTWLMWVIGIPVALLVLALAALGIAFLLSFGKVRW